MICKVGDRVRINALWSGVSEGKVSKVEHLGFQVEGHKVWFGWHELVSVDSSSLEEEPRG